jgi:glycosyltransferase involved in cell wall biosynthesis
MRILHLSTWETGGAAIAATRLSNTLSGLGVKSKVLHMSSRFPAYVDTAIGKLTRTPNPIFHSYNYYGANIEDKIAQFKPDFIHIHWIGAGFITPESVAKFGLPIVWTLHDLWPLCGAEHLPGSSRMIDGYLSSNRPSIDKGLDLDRYVWERKLKSFKDLNITYIAPSHYVYEQAKQAKALGIHKLVYIPNGVDVKIFHPVELKTTNKKIVLFVANNPELDMNKGYLDFQKAISLLPDKLRMNIEVKVVSGEISSEKELANIYSTAVVTVVPSKMETLSYVTMESLACGTPVVAYRVGGIPDLIDHQTNGYLANPGEIKDLARGIESIVTSPKIIAEYSKSGRAKIIKHFSMDNIAKKYLDLYRQMY